MTSSKLPEVAAKESFGMMVVHGLKIIGALVVVVQGIGIPLITTFVFPPTMQADPVTMGVATLMMGFGTATAIRLRERAGK